MRSRDSWLDNVKLTLVTLVVVGHSWGLVVDSPLGGQLYDFVYYWHIPAFVAVTGHLSRSFEWDRRHFASLATTVVLPYLLFEFGLFHFRAAIGQHEQGPLWLQPHWGMWYLCVLFFWRLATPVLRRHWAAVPASVAVSLLAGLLDTLVLGMPRILGLLPFFVLGLHLERRHLDLLVGRWRRPAAVATLAGIFGLAATTDAWARSAFLYYDAGYEALGYPALQAMGIRLEVMAIGLAGTAAVLALVPRRTTLLTSCGAATLVVYLFHGFVVRYADSAGAGQWVMAHGVAGLVALTGTAVALSLLLAAPPVSGRLRWLVDPVGSVRRSPSAWRRVEPEPVRASRRSVHYAEVTGPLSTDSRV